MLAIAVSAASARHHAKFKRSYFKCGFKRGFNSRSLRNSHQSSCPSLDSCTGLDRAASNPAQRCFELTAPIAQINLPDRFA